MLYSSSSVRLMVILCLPHLSICHNNFLPSVPSSKCRWMRIIILLNLKTLTTYCPALCWGWRTTPAWSGVNAGWTKGFWQQKLIRHTPLLLSSFHFFCILMLAQTFPVLPLIQLYGFLLSLFVLLNPTTPLLRFCAPYLLSVLFGYECVSVWMSFGV